MGISNYSMYDVSTRLAGTTGITSALKAENSTARENNTDLDMTDFLQLMIVQLQSQTIDDTMDTSDMLNQMVQMQMITALTNMTETNIMTYASSLVGKEVTIGIVNGTTLEEIPVTVIGTGMSNGQQVIFCEDEKGNVNTYNLNQIMAVGKLPPKEEEGEDTESGKTDPDEAVGNSGAAAGSGQTTNPDSGDSIDTSDENGKDSAVSGVEEAQG